jgi:hypothetical protein
MSTPSSPGTASGDAVDALQAALAAENMIVWAYGLSTAFVKGDNAKAVNAAAVNHRARRDVCQRVLRAAGTQPAPPQAGYRPPQLVTDEKSAMALLAVAETDGTGAWRALLERTDDAALRSTGLDALVYAAVQATHWRKLTGQVPSAAALPGAPS